MTDQRDAQLIADDATTGRAISPRRKGDRLTDFLVRRFKPICQLSRGEADLVRDASATAREIDRNVSWRAPRSGEVAPAFVASGWSAVECHLADGRRQILSLLLPGDEIGFAGRFLPQSAAVVALTRTIIVDAAELLDAACNDPEGDGLACARRHLAEVSEAFLLNQILRLGRMTAFERVAHLFAELHWRLGQVGFAGARGTILPLSQETIAHTLGLSAIHVNRTLRQLKEDGLVEIKSGKAWLAGAGRLAEISGFAPPPINGKAKVAE